MDSVPPLHDQVRAIWTRGAEGYDRDVGHGGLTPGLERVWKGVLTEVLGAEARHILDVGTGTGLLAVEAAKLGHRVTGVDLTPGMLQHAHRRSAQAGVEVTWDEGDGMALPYADSSFDVVMSRHVLWTIPDPTAAFREWIRVTRSGGRVVWFDSLWPDPDRLVTGLQSRMASIVETILSRHQEHSDHHYPESVASQLPLSGLTSARPLRLLLRDLGVPHPTIRRVSRLRREERRARPLAQRLRPLGDRYVGWFDVTDAMKSAAGRAPTG